MNRLTTLALAAAAALLATAAQAAVTFNFTPGSDTAGTGYSPTAGYTVVNDFNQASDLNAITSGNDYSLQGPGSTTTGADPAFPSNDGTTYLSVEAGGVANVDFAKTFNGSFQFDWGSIDDYNTLTIHTTTGDVVYVPGSGSFANPANGDQFSGLTNGVFTIFGSGITGFSLSSSKNSFEIDNFAVLSTGTNPLGGGVPEPATWAMMIIGFGGIGALLRRRRALALVAAA